MEHNKQFDPNFSLFGEEEAAACGESYKFNLWFELTVSPTVQTFDGISLRSVELKLNTHFDLLAHSPHSWLCTLQFPCQTVQLYVLPSASCSLFMSRGYIFLPSFMQSVLSHCLVVPPCLFCRPKILDSSDKDCNTAALLLQHHYYYFRPAIKSSNPLDSEFYSNLKSANRILKTKAHLLE